MNSARIPRFAYVVGVLLVLFGVYLTFSAFADPTSLVAGFDRTSAPNAQIQLMWAGRFLAMVVALLIALAARSALLLALVLAMRFVTECVDSVAFLRAGSVTGYAVIVVAVVELVTLCVLVRQLRGADAVAPAR